MYSEAQHSPLLTKEEKKSMSEEQDSTHWKTTCKLTPINKQTADFFHLCTEEPVNSTECRNLTAQEKPEISKISAKQEIQR